HTRSKRDWSSDVCSSDLDFARDEMRAIEFDRDLRGEPTLLQRVRRVFRIRRCRKKITTHSDENADPAVVHLLDRFDGVRAGFARSEERRVGKECGCWWVR